jgi:hypothetical protein
MARRTKDPLLDEVVADLVRRHRCHTVILYGSHAHGSPGPESDYDVLAIRRSGRMTRDARVWRGATLDAFVVGEVALRRTPPADLVRIHDGVVLMEKDRQGSRLLARVKAAHARGPEPLPPDEVEATRVWGDKMVRRLASATSEPAVAAYRRASLLTELLPIYFQVRRRWFPGPGPAFRWLAEHDPEVHQAFEWALRPAATPGVIERLVALVVGRDL